MKRKNKAILNATLKTFLYIMCLVSMNCLMTYLFNENRLPKIGALIIFSFILLVSERIFYKSVFNLLEFDVTYNIVISNNDPSKLSSEEEIKRLKLFTIPFILTLLIMMYLFPINSWQAGILIFLFALQFFVGEIAKYRNDIYSEHIEEIRINN